MNWSVIIGIFGTLAGFALSYLAFARNSKKDSADAGKESGTVLTEIGYIKANTDDIKRKQEKQDETLVKMTERVVKLEGDSAARTSGLKFWSPTITGAANDQKARPSAHEDQSSVCRSMGVCKRLSVIQQTSLLRRFVD